MEKLFVALELHGSHLLMLKNGSTLQQCDFRHFNGSVV